MSRRSDYPRPRHRWPIRPVHRTCPSLLLTAGPRRCGRWGPRAGPCWSRSIGDGRSLRRRCPASRAGRRVPASRTLRLRENGEILGASESPAVRSTARSSAVCANVKEDQTRFLERTWGDLCGPGPSEAVRRRQRLLPHSPSGVASLQLPGIKVLGKLAPSYHSTPTHVSDFDRPVPPSQGGTHGLPLQLSSCERLVSAGLSLFGVEGMTSSVKATSLSLPARTRPSVQEWSTPPLRC